MIYDVHITHYITIAIIHTYIHIHTKPIQNKEGREYSLEVLASN